MRTFVSVAAVSALLAGGASFALAQGPGAGPGGDPKPPMREGAPPSGDKKAAPERKDSGPSDPGKSDARAGDSDSSGKKAESPPDTKKKDSTAGDGASDKSDRKADSGRKETTPKSSVSGDDKSDRKTTTDTRRKDDTGKTATPGDDKSRDKSDAKSRDKAADTRRKDETPKAAAPGDAGDKAAARSGDDKKGVQISEQKRTQLHEKLGRDRSRHSTNVRISVSIGATVPRNVDFYELPPDVVQIVPEYRSYRYVWVGDEIVIIDPARYVVIAVVGGGGHAAAPRGGDRLTLTSAERRIITERVAKGGGHAVHERIDVGGRIPDAVALMAFPDDVVADVPKLRGYRYVFVENDIAIVDPNDTTVLVRIDH